MPTAASAFANHLGFETVALGVIRPIQPDVDVCAQLQRRQVVRLLGEHAVKIG